MIPIDVGRQLFVDGFLTEQTNLVRVQHRPTFYEGNPILEPEGAFDINTFAAPFSDGVWFDPSDNQFKMWYFGGFGNFPPPYVSYASSSDGKNWIKPLLPNAVIPNTNMVILKPRDSSTVWMDLEEPDPSRKFKAFVYSGGRKMNVYYSADGIQWQDQPFEVETISDRTTVFWNPFRQVWVNSLRANMTLPATPERPSYGSRVRFYSESEDFLDWNPADLTASFWTGPDTNDPPYDGPGGTPPDLYNLDAVAYESLIVGLFSWFYEAPGPDLVEIGVGFSRDGFHWYRPTRGGGDQAFIPASNTPNTWDGYNSQSVGGGFLVVGDQLWFYFSGRDTQHSIPANAMSTGLAMLRRDGFYSMHADDTAGTLTTRPVVFSGNRLFVNVDNPDGELRVEILDLNNNVIGPFTQQASVPIADDTTSREVTWAGVGNLQSLAGTPVKIRFHLTNGHLYSFWVSSGPSGASQGYLAAGGPGYGGLVDVVGSGYDTTPPEGALIHPVQAQALSEIVRLEATASDNIRVKGVRFLIDGAEVSPEIKTEPYEFFFDTRNLSDGLHTVEAVIRDGADNESTTPSIDVTTTNTGVPDTTPPSVNMTFPGPGVEVSGTILLAANASDNSVVAGVQFQIDGGNVGAELIGLPWVFSLDTTTLSDGAHSATAVARDPVGNTATAAAVNFTVNNAPPPPPPPDNGDPPPGPDTIPPTVLITSPVNRPWVSGSAMLTADAGDNVGVAGVQFQVNGIDVGPADTAEPYQFSLDTTVLADAVHVVTATAEDAAGNKATSGIEYIRVDNVAGQPQTTEIRGLFQEAELGSRRSMLVAHDPTAFGLRYVHVQASAPDGGSVSYRLRLSEPAPYVIWGRVVAPDSTADFYQVSINGGPQHSYDATQGRSSPDWQWTRIHGAAPGGLNPMITQLGNAYHTVLFEAQDLDARLDGFLITNDLYFVPTDAQYLPPPEGSGEPPTPPVDGTPPLRSNGLPFGALPAGTIQTTLSLTTNEFATCKYAQSPGTAYSAMLNFFATTGGASHSTDVSGLQDGSVNSYYARCTDPAGNFNTDDFLIQFSIADPPAVPTDNAPPVRSNGSPSGALAAGTTQATLALTTDELATCRYSTNPNTGFAGMPNVFVSTGGTSHSTGVSGLQNGSANSYYARCQDPAGNANINDFPIQFSIANPPPAGSVPDFADYTEAELGRRRRVQVGHDVQASGSRYVWTPDFAADGSGSVEYRVTLPTLDIYVIWARVRTPSAQLGKFSVQVGNGTPIQYDTAVSGATGAWKWLPVYSDPLTLAPQIYALPAGLHTIRFGSLDEGATIDGLLITNDPTHVPTNDLYLNLP